MCDIELVLAYKTPQGYADCSRTLEEYKNQIRVEVIDELYTKIDDGVCDICEHKDFEGNCWRTCKFEMYNAKKWLLDLKEQKL